MTKKYDNSGSVSKNTRKEKDTHPDIRGKATIAGVDYWIDGWQKQGENGTWYSLRFKPKDESEPAKASRAVSGDDGDSDVPF